MLLGYRRASKVKGSRCLDLQRDVLYDDGLARSPREGSSGPMAAEWT